MSKMRFGTFSAIAALVAVGHATLFYDYCREQLESFDDYDPVNGSGLVHISSDTLTASLRLQFPKAFKVFDGAMLMDFFPRIVETDRNFGDLSDFVVSENSVAEIQLDGREWVPLERFIPGYYGQVYETTGYPNPGGRELTALRCNHTVVENPAGTIPDDHLYLKAFDGRIQNYRRQFCPRRTSGYYIGLIALVLTTLLGAFGLWRASPANGKPFFYYGVLILISLVHLGFILYCDWIGDMEQSSNEIGLIAVTHHGELGRATAFTSWAFIFGFNIWWYRSLARNPEMKSKWKQPLTGGVATLYVLGFTVDPVLVIFFYTLFFWIWIPVLIVAYMIDKHIINNDAKMNDAD